MNVRNHGLRLSQGTVGDCYYNVPIESLAGRMRTELLKARKWTTAEQLSVAIGDHVEKIDNTRRHHSAPDILTPTEFETLDTPRLHHA